MRGAMLSILLSIGLLGTAEAGELKWPNAWIAIPPEVDAFIRSECRGLKLLVDTGCKACVRAES